MSDIQKYGQDVLMAGFEGVDSSDLAFPSLHLYQGTMQEEEKYPDRKRGEWLNGSTGDPVSKPVSLAAVLKYASAFWSQDATSGSGIVGSWPGWYDVPADIEKNPEIEVTRGYILFFRIEGEAFPFVFRAKRTGIKTAKQLLTAEFSRAQSGKLPGVYTLSSRTEKNAKGQPYLVPVWSATGGSVDDAAMADIIEIRKMVSAQSRRIIARSESAPGSASESAPGDQPVTSQKDADDEIPF